MDPAFSLATVNLTPQTEREDPQDGNSLDYWDRRATELESKKTKKKKNSLDLEPKMHLFVHFLSS